MQMWMIVFRVIEYRRATLVCANENHLCFIPLFFPHFFVHCIFDVWNCTKTVQPFAKGAELIAIYFVSSCFCGSWT